MYQYHYRKPKKKPIYKKPLLWIVLIILTIGTIFFVHKKVVPVIQEKQKEKVENKQYISECDHVKYASAPISPSNKLNDPNELQLVHALKNGLKRPFTTDNEFFASLDSLKRKSILLEVTENNFYQLKSLTHSQPYLIPEAIDMLNEIGYRFQKRLEDKKKNSFRFRITSLLRTEEEQTKLSHRNRNATSHSTHIYGSTVDISYKNFYNIRKDTIEASYDAVQALTTVLLEMRQECKLLAVREHHQSCFHITVVVCKPFEE